MRRGQINEWSMSMVPYKASLEYRRSIVVVWEEHHMAYDRNKHGEKDGKRHEGQQKGKKDGEKK